jgi:hypothetical protein
MRCVSSATACRGPSRFPRSQGEPESRRCESSGRPLRWTYADDETPGAPAMRGRATFHLEVVLLNVPFAQRLCADTDLVNQKEKDMEKREITDWRGRGTGEIVARYAWRSKPTQSPAIDRPVRCIVAQDEKGQYWAGTRIGRGNGKNAETEFWQPFETKERAVAVSREVTRSFLSMQAEVYADTVTGKKPGEQMVKVTMDDGWSVAIHAAGRITPGEAKLQALFGGTGKSKPPSRQPSKKDRGWNWPSR